MHRSTPLRTAIIITAALCAFAAHAAPSQKTKTPPSAPSVAPPGSIVVSNHELTTFIFPHPVTTFTASADTTIEGDPIYQAGKTQIIVQFGKMKKAGQLVVGLANGDVLNLRVFASDVPGTIQSINNARKPSSKPAPSPAADPASPSAADVELLRILVSNNEPPAGFDPLVLPAPVSFDKFTIVPLASWSNGTKRISVFSLVSNNGATAVVSPPQFYREGVAAVMVDGDSIDANTSPTLFIVEDEAQ